MSGVMCSFVDHAWTTVKFALSNGQKTLMLLNGVAFLEKIKIHFISC